MTKWEVAAFAASSFFTLIFVILFPKGDSAIDLAKRMEAAAKEEVAALQIAKQRKSRADIELLREENNQLRAALKNAETLQAE